jgi:hypothetical protein
MIGDMYSGNRQVTQEEAWQITCHEAGHAVVAVRLNIPILHVERGDAEHGEVPPGVGPIDSPNHNWTVDKVSQWQLFYAAGAAAEKLLFGNYREYAARGDRSRHAQLEKRWCPNRSKGWDQDIQAAIEILDRGSIEKVAKELDQRGKLSEEDVYQLLDRIPPCC